VFLIYVITLGLYVLLAIRKLVWGYLIAVSIMRLEEFVILFIAISIIQTYYVGNPLKNWKNAWATLTTSHDTNTKSQKVQMVDQ